MTTQARPMLRRPLRHFTERSILGLLLVVGGGAGFGLLLLAVRGRWMPLQSTDRGISAELNAAVAPNDALIDALDVISAFGGRPIMLWLVGLCVAGLLIRRQSRLAIYLVVVGVGALFLDPSLKLLVGRLRPVVEMPISSAPGHSFPSGHALGSTVVYGALLLVFLPALPRRVRPFIVAGVGVLVLAIGATRVALGVHYVSDVLAGWLLGVAWLGVTAHAFRLWRRELGRPVPPLADGLEPEAAAEIAPAPEERRVLPHALVGWAEIATGWVLVFGVLYLFGTLVSRYADGTVVRDVDLAVVRWLAERRTTGLNDLSYWWSKAGDTHAILPISLVTCALLVAATRRWRPVLFLALAMIGELSLFLASAAAVGRPRPPVEHLDGPLPTSAFPSGHIAATMCLWTAIALLVFPRTRHGTRWLAVAPVAVMPAGVALSRMYRGMHHPTDVLGAALLTVLWVGVLWWVIRPNADLTHRVAVPAARRPPTGAPTTGSRPTTTSTAETGSTAGTRHTGVRPAAGPP